MSWVRGSNEEELAQTYVLGSVSINSLEGETEGRGMNCDDCMNFLVKGKHYRCRHGKFDRYFRRPPQLELLKACSEGNPCPHFDDADGEE